MRFSLRLIWKACRQARCASRCLYYRLLPGLYFRRLGGGTRIYGPLRFGNVPCNLEVGRHCLLGAGLFFATSETGHIRIGDRCSINTGSHLVAVEAIQIGDGSLLGEYVTIRDQNHGFADPARFIRDQGFNVKPVIIGRDVWVGRGVYIGPGVEIGDGCVIGANSVVTHSVPAYVIAVGAPARVIKQRLLSSDAT